MKRALISVSDKRGIIDFAQKLVNLGWEIVSTGGTAKTLREAGVEVIGISEVTGFPEILEGRVKTLHPMVHGGILAKDTPEHLQVLVEHGIALIDMVVVNLYPFQETIAKAGVTLEDAIENIDIGGPTMVRAAAKNFQRVAVVVNPSKYPTLIKELESSEQLSLATRKQLAWEAFSHTAQYDLAISQYLGNLADDGQFPPNILMVGEKVQDLRYGENPHQKAAFYTFTNNQGTIAGAKQLQGKELSYNNIVDVEAAWAVVKDFTGTSAATIIKHTNPCGTALGNTIFEAYKKALVADPVSAFGGIVGVNGEVDKETALEIAKTFMEAVVALKFSPEALAIFQEKKNLRLIEMGEGQVGPELWIEKVSGGFLVQELDSLIIKAEDLKLVTQAKVSPEQLEELLFAWQVVKHVKSNAIVIAKDKQSIGVGAGQMNRVGAAKIALEQAQGKLAGAVLASDAFFPFRDTIDLVAQMGIRAIIQPGGSIRDEEVIAACNEHGIAMVFTGVRHFKH